MILAKVSREQKDKWEESGARGGEVCGGQVRFEKVGAIIA